MKSAPSTTTSDDERCVLFLESNLSKALAVGSGRGFAFLGDDERSAGSWGE